MQTASQATSYEQAIVGLLHRLPQEKLAVEFDFVSYLAERDPDQAWFWTPVWQAAEREADEDIRAGRVETFATMDEFMNTLFDASVGPSGKPETPQS